ncbi:MAG: hypothetical protein HY901_29600, partial [Deltaproteobacteria bacterium]|nr:hypothetical protein [Deltaproteobacteria bacterium]
MNRPIRPVDASSLRPLDRAAIALKQAPICAAAAATNTRIATALQSELRAPFACAARIEETPWRLRGLPAGCCYLVFALAAEGRRALLELETGFAAALVDRLSGGTDCAFAPQEPSAAEIAALAYLALNAMRAARASEPIEAALSPRFLQIARDAREVSSILAKERSWVSVELDLSVGEVQGGGRLL